MNILKYSFMLLSSVTLAMSACGNDEPLVRYEPIEPGPGPDPGEEYATSRPRTSDSRPTTRSNTASSRTPTSRAAIRATITVR